MPSVLRIADPDAIRPRHVVMIILVIVTVGGGALLLSASDPDVFRDGAVDWQEQSPLRAVVELLCLGYQFPTNYAGDVKNYILGLGSGLALLALGIALVARGRSADEAAQAKPRNQPAPTEANANDESPPTDTKPQMAPLLAAQVLIVLYLGWTLLSSAWSSAPGLSLGAGVLLTIQLLWSLAIGNGLNPKAARIAARIVLTISTFAATIAIWYFMERNWRLRAKFPFGNPTFLAAALIPGILLGVAYLCELIERARRGRPMSQVPLMIAALAAVGVTGWAFYLTGSRGGAVGLVFGLLAMAMFALRGRARWLPVVLAVLLAVGGSWYFLRSSEAGGGRGVTIRLRLAAWQYALDMVSDKPLLGHGRGGFTLLGDAYAVNDVLADPEALKTRIAHVHNEWLEVMVDVGSIGLVLIAVALVLSIKAGLLAMRATPHRAERWTLVALLGGLVALIVEESFGVGLRVSGVATMFFTMLGLIWALSGYRATGLVDRIASLKQGRIAGAVVCGFLGIGALLATQRDFSAARLAHEVGTKFRENDFDALFPLARGAVGRLDPQRSLLNRFRLSESHLLAAEWFGARAHDREKRAYTEDPVNQRLQFLANEDYGLSNDHCRQGIDSLDILTTQSPGFINHGVLAYRLHLALANNPPVREDPAQQLAELRDAGLAIQVELQRQPFDPEIAAAYVIALLSLDGANVDRSVLNEALARPLRYRSIESAYVDLLMQDNVAAIVNSSIEPDAAAEPAAAHSETSPAKANEPAETWLPERLRLACAARFLRGDHKTAVPLLERAVRLYENMPIPRPLGAAACVAELADGRFFADPFDAESALNIAQQAVDMTPKSLNGRKLALRILTRMVDYHLALGDEHIAVSLLRETGPPNADQALIVQELAARYIRLCKTFLEPVVVGPPAPDARPDRMTQLRRWSARSIELNSSDPEAYLVASELSVRDGNDAAVAAHLLHAIQRGLDPGATLQSLSVALDRFPKSEPLNQLRAKLSIPLNEILRVQKSTAEGFAVEPPTPKPESDLPGDSTRNP